MIELYTYIVLIYYVISFSPKAQLFKRVQDQVWNAIFPHVSYMTSVSEFGKSTVSIKYSYVTSFSIEGNEFVKNKWQ